MSQENKEKQISYCCGAIKDVCDREPFLGCSVKEHCSQCGNRFIPQPPESKEDKPIKKEGSRIGYRCDSCKEDFTVDSAQLIEEYIGNFFNMVHQKCGRATYSIYESLEEKGVKTTLLNTYIKKDHSMCCQFSDEAEKPPKEITDIFDSRLTPPTDSNSWEEKIKKILSVYNAEILNQFQNEYLMQKGPGCEKILFPVLEKATKYFIDPPNDGIKRDFRLKDHIDFILQQERQREREKIFEDILKYSVEFEINNEEGITEEAVPVNDILALIKNKEDSK